MTKRHPADAVRDVMVDFATKEDAKGLADAAELAGGINDILADPDVVAALDAADPAQTAELRDLMAKMQNMETITQAMVAADASGDQGAMDALSAQFQELSPASEFEPEVLGAPYDAIRDAIWEDDADALGGALAGAPDLNVLLGQYQTFPLALAAMSYEESRLDLVNLLLSHGANAAFATPEGYTALHFLIDSPDRADTVSMIDTLLAAGADIEARNHYGWTPMLQAVMEGSPLVLKTLLARGANVHARFDDSSMPPFSRGCTAMMAASYEPDKIEVLLNAGADPAGAHDDGRGFNAYADDALRDLDEDDTFATLIERSRALINSARLH